MGLHVCVCVCVCDLLIQVGGAVREVTGYSATYQHTFSVDKGDAEGDCLHVRQGYYHSIEGFPDCVVADAVINFFMARTDKMLRVGFDPRFARRGHLGKCGFLNCLYALFIFMSVFICLPE